MLEVGTRFTIKGDWDTTPTPAGRLEIKLTPSRIFGEGGHPSTKAILEEMETLIKPGDSVVDVGTGSGILAIAAAKLGATQVLAVDINEDALAVATANVIANSVEGMVTVIKTEWPKPMADPVNLVVMNIDKTALIASLLDKINLAPLGHVVVVCVAEDQTILEATTTLSLLRTRPAGAYMQRPDGRRTFIPSRKQWIALTFRR